MTVWRELGRYAYTTTTTTSFNFSFSPATAGRRIVVAVCTGPKALTSFTSGYTRDAESEGSFGVYVYSKIAAGGESSVSWSIGSKDSSQFAIAYEVDAPNVLFAGGDWATGGTLSVDVDVPAGALNPFVVGVSAAGSTSAASATWNNGLTTDYDAFGSNSNAIEVFFASGTTLPAAGTATYTSTTVYSGNLIPIVVVGYGQADAVPPTVPSGFHATSVSGTSISVAWSASTDNIGVTGYGVYRDGTKVAEQAGISYDFVGLTPGQAYLIEVDAVDGGGNRSARAALTVTTDGTPPTTPTGLAVTAVTPYSVTLSWSASTDNLGVAGYGAYVGAAKYGPDVPGTSVTVGGLTPSTAYTLGVDAVDQAGNRSAKATVGATTTSDLPPSTPGGLVADLVQGTAFRVSWSASSDDYALAGYGVWLDGVKVGEQVELTRTFTGLARGVTYLVEVDAVDNIGQRSPAKASVEVTTIASTVPSTPGGLTATAEGDTISLAWAASVDDTGIARYEVLLDGQVVATTTAQAYVLEDLVRGSTYLVEVVAVDEDGGRSAPAAVLAKLPPPSWAPISSPTYELGEWAGNARDQHGVYWAVTSEDGWSDSPPVTVLVAEADATDGAFVGPGRYGARLIALSGVADAPTRVAMLAAQERLQSVLPPGQVGLLRVAEAHMTRQAEVRLADVIDITDMGALAFRWTLTVRAGDPRRYAITPIYAEATPVAMPGTATISVELAGDYPTIPGVLTVFGPIKDFTITHAESGLVIMAKPGVELPADDRYSVEIDLRSRLVWAHVPEDVDPEPRPGRSLLARFPAWFALQPGPNTLILSGAAGTDPGRPRLVLSARDAWQ